MSNTTSWFVEVDPEATWEVWYEDTFDRDCPRQIEVAGQGLTAGLSELWSRHLYETVQVDGQQGFSRFNLWWIQQRKSVAVVGPWAGMVQIRSWIFGNKRQIHKAYARGGQELLTTIAGTHGYLLLAGQSSERILVTAVEAMNREDFVKRLGDIL
jgi:hypothetical protein